MSENGDSPDNENVAAALEFMKKAGREVFALCAEAAESMACAVERGDLPMDAPTALRVLASMFVASAKK